jgi:hypothetical protein
LAFFLACGGGCLCWRRHNRECFLQHFALFPPFQPILLPWDRHRQRINELICSYTKRVSFRCRVFTSNNLENFNNHITAISESGCTSELRVCYFKDTTLRNIKLSVIQIKTLRRILL